MRTLTQIEAAAAYLRTRSATPEAILLIGSGYSSLISKLSGVTEIPFRDIPDFPQWLGDDSAALVCGEFGGKRLVLVTKRFQYCYGCSADDLAFPLRVLKSWGATTMIVTNAAGGINPAYEVGSFVAITDHIDFTSRNPLIGANLDALGPRFPDMSEIYTRRLLDVCLRTANELGIDVRTGVYLGVTGPSYETPAEIRAFRILGADLVGMSTVSEAIVARHAGLAVLAVSTVTNQAAGNTPLLLAHEDVLKVTSRKATQMAELLEAVISRL